MKTNHPSGKAIIDRLLEIHFSTGEDDPWRPMTKEEATQALEARFRAMMEEVIGEYPSAKNWQEEVTDTSKEIRERFYQRRVGKDQLIAEQRQRIDQVIRENFGGRE
jgi:hypothetical protein